MDYAIVMAGGTGKRLWPLSRRKRPKQVLKLLDGHTLLRRCFERLVPIFDLRNIIILTNAGYADLVRENLPELPFNNVIAEPAVRDTSGAIGLAATILTKFDPDAAMAVVTADQLIEPAEIFQQALKDALTFVGANPNAMITFGIQPSFPSTQLGYIKCIAPCEKPGCKNKVYTVNLANFLPESVEPLRKIRNDWDGPNQQKSLQQWFLKLPKISIDYAVMEKADDVYALKLDCRWLDMGAFTALADFVTSDKDNNIVVAGHSRLLDCKDNIIVTEERNHLIAAIGMENIVVAHSPDATLICHIDQAQRLKELLELIEKDTGEKFL
jgi:mannose-1-phosphate guanylyltransferase